MTMPETTPTRDEERPSDSSPHEARPAPVAPVIRGLRVMAIVRWVLLALVTTLAAYTVWTFWGPESTPSSTVGPDRYYCPMHPQIRSPDPGECPICHMDLEPIPAERQAEAAPAEGPGVPHARPTDVTPVTISAEQQQLIGLATSVVSDERIGDHLRVPGVVVAPETGLAQVRVRAVGFVERVVVRQTGVRVARGQTLAFVYSPEIYRAQEEFLAATRWSTTASGTPAEGATDVLPSARRGLELLGLSAADIDEVVRSGHAIRAVPIRAGSSGYVTRFNAVLGSRADPETVLYEIADLSRVWVIASVHERDLNNLRVGMLAQFAPSGSTTSTIGARIDLIEPALDEDTRTVRVRLVVPNRDSVLRPGQFGEVVLALSPAQGLFIPRDAVIHTGEHEYVYVGVGTDRFEPRIVRTGLSSGDRVQVVEGVAVGDRVVTRGSFMLDSESRLQASLGASPSARLPDGASTSVELDPACDTAFDRERFPDKHTQCRACEREHAGMGNMVADCKNAIPRPWR